MRNYLDLLSNILENGVKEPNRTGIDCYTLPGAMLKFDLSPTGPGFPAVTTKRLAFKAVVGELIAFLRGSTSLQEFKDLGCNVWDANVHAPGWQNNGYAKDLNDMGKIYSHQWRNFGGDANKGIPGVDQIKNALLMVRETPESRRIIVNAWNPQQIHEACLPPCHVLFQLIPHSSTKKLHMVMYQRSCDMFLGIPFNIASYSILLHLFAAWTGYTPGTLTMMLADVHIYENHLTQVQEQLTRKPKCPPFLKLNLPIGVQQMDINEIVSPLCLQPSDIILEDYVSHPAISAPMAV